MIKRILVTLSMAAIAFAGAVAAPGAAHDSVAICPITSATHRERPKPALQAPLGGFLPLAATLDTYAFAMWQWSIGAGGLWLAVHFHRSPSVWVGRSNRPRGGSTIGVRPRA